MSTILVTGGTGALGRHIVSSLRERGDDVRVLSRRPGAGTHVGDLASGAGVAEATRGAELIVHAASDFRRRFGKVDIAQTQRLIAATGDARHLLQVSIVGIDSIPYAYYRNKLECERLIATSGIRHTILRATQFHELLAWPLRASERFPLALLPLDFRFQPIAAAEVGGRAAELIHATPLNGRLDFGGPEVLTLAQMAELWRAERGRPRRLARLPIPGELGRAFREGRNTCPEQAEGRQTWAQFVASNAENPYTMKGSR